MQIYTRTGDDGTTGLFFGGRVRKDDPRPEAYGTVDEAQAAIGWAGNGQRGRTARRGARRLDPGAHATRPVGA